MSALEAETAEFATTSVPARVSVPREGPLTPEQAVEAYRRALVRGDDWYRALLDVIARWTAASEVVDGVVQRYLIAGEAFDWLLLAQRLIDAAEDLVPAEHAERLLIFGLAPRNESEEEFEAAIGPAKYRAHLNFQYGVVVEELLLLAAELELAKAGHLSVAGRPAPDVLAYEHVYGKSLEELKVLYNVEANEVVSERISQSDLQAFTYWLSKYRVRTAEPARVASDTRKAMAMLSRLETGRARLARLQEGQTTRHVVDDLRRRGIPRAALRPGRLETARKNQAPSSGAKRAT